jgi:hypothetical protein
VKPLLFLDFDGVICRGMPYGHFDLVAAERVRPKDIWERLWNPPAVETLLAVMTELQPSVVITTSWLSLTDRAGFDEIFTRTGLDLVAAALDTREWQAPQLCEPKVGLTSDHLPQIRAALSLHR